MYLKYPSKITKIEKPTTTDLLERVQNLSNEWFIKGLPERPKDKSSERKTEDIEDEKHTAPFVYE